MTVQAQTAGAIQMRKWRASLSPKERAAYLARRVEYNRQRREKNPVARAKEKATRLRGYHRAMANPKRRAAIQEAACAKYRANYQWRIVQAAGLRSAERGFEFDLTKEWIRSVWTGKCAVTGIPFVLGDKRNPFSASLDRVDNTRGYTQDNCRWVLWAVNLLKHTGTDAEMFEIAKAIAGSAP